MTFAGSPAACTAPSSARSVAARFSAARTSALGHFSKADLLASKPAAVTLRGSPSPVSELNIARANWIRLPVEKTGRLRLQRCRGRGVASEGCARFAPWLWNRSN